MERNNDLPAGENGPAGGSSATGGTGGTGGVGGYGDTGDLTGAQGYGAGTGATTGSATTTGQPGIGDQEQGLGGRARDALGDVKHRAADLGSTVRERAGVAKNSLADALQSGAEKLRQRGQSATGTPSYAGATGDGTTSVGVSTTSGGHVNERLAGGMQATADWLRDADLESMRTGIERQVKDHPGRTLLIALGLGYVLGKAFRK